ncbi:hypothetical protein [Pleionea mediterranea]|nr:hypothetical protein [Pleionea mediterranea]
MSDDEFKSVSERLKEKKAKKLEALKRAKEEQEFLKSWLVDDSDWVSERKRKWLSMHKRLKQLFFLDKYNIETCKNYFMAGKEAFALSSCRGGFWLEFWLHPEHTLKNFNKIKIKYIKNNMQNKIHSHSREFLYFMEGIEYCDRDKKDYVLKFEGDSFFDGLEDLFWEELVPKQFEGEKAFQSDCDLLNFAKEKSRRMTAKFHAYLSASSLIEANIIKYRVPYWAGAFKLGYESLPEEWRSFIPLVDKICDQPYDYHPLQVKVASEISDVFNEPDILDGAKVDIEKARKCEL